jgi:quercetin dioxygenase-like cupin family protein
MAKAGQEIYNPRQKDRIVFKKTARETGGELLQMELFASPNAAPPPDHVHPRQEEHFETISGTLRARVGGEERTLRAGERMVVPAGVGHTFWIEGEEDAHVLVELRPARNTETFLETMYGLVSDGKADENGVPPLLQIAILGLTYDTYLPSPPIVLQKALFAVLAPVGRLMGYRASYPEYSGEDPLVEVDGSGGGGRRAGMIVATVGALVIAVTLLRRRASRR